jgi:hypothetical protein
MTELELIAEYKQRYDPTVHPNPLTEGEMRMLRFCMQKLSRPSEQRVIEVLENLLFEYGWITRPHGDETDDLLEDFARELSGEKADEKEIASDIISGLRQKGKIDLSGRVQFSEPTAGKVNFSTK